MKGSIKFHLLLYVTRATFFYTLYGIYDNYQVNSTRCYICNKVLLYKMDYVFILKYTVNLFIYLYVSLSLLYQKESEDFSDPY